MLANMGSPMMWSEFFALTVGNVLLGCIEGAYLVGRARVPVLRSVGVMLAANFVSAFLGAFLLRLNADVDFTIENVVAFLVLGVVATFVLTVLIEWPFVKFVLAPTRATSRRALMATLQIHAITYPAMLALWLFSGDFALFRHWDVVAVERLLPTTRHELFYVVGNRVVRRDLAGGEMTTVATLTMDEVYGGLTMRVDSGGGAVLECVLSRAYPQAATSRTLLSGLLGLEPRPVTPSLPHFADREQRGSLVDLHLETGCASWSAGDSIQLSDDLHLVEFGGDQLILAKPSSREIALVARGRRPAAAAVRP